MPCMPNKRGTCGQWHEVRFRGDVRDHILTKRIKPMITGYLPLLKAPDDKSSDWYKEFHNLYYLSQLTNMLLLSYVDSFYELYSKEAILNEKHDYLVLNEIVTIGQDDTMVIVDEDEVKSIEVEDFLEDIIENKFRAHAEMMSVHFAMIGLELEGSLDKKTEVNIKDLLKSTNAKNWYGVVKGFLNIWEFLFLYSIIETTVKKHLNLTGQVHEENLLKLIFEKYPTLMAKVEEEISVDSHAITDLWVLYTGFRNIYSHSHGIITKYAKSSLAGKLQNFKDSFNVKGIHNVLVEADKLFQNDMLVKDKFYLLQDIELNIFRNFIIALVENLEKVNISS